MVIADRRRLAVALLTLVVGGGLSPAALGAGAFKRVAPDGSVQYDDQHRFDHRLTRDDLKGRQVPASPDATIPEAFSAAVATDCQLARERVDVHRSASVVYRRDRTGKSHRLSPRQRQLELAALESAVTRNCAPDAAEVLHRELRAERERQQQKPRQIVVEQRGP